MKYKYHVTLLIAALVVCFGSCRKDKMEQYSEEEYSRWVGDIAFDPNSDNADFELCHREENVLQYFNFGQGFQYKGEKTAILEVFGKSYKPVSDPSANGMIRIRFIVNCYGETDRFRVLSADENYQPKTFDKNIIDQVLNITKSLTGWKILESEGAPRDYYQYLIFKMKHGEIYEILP